MKINTQIDSRDFSNPNRTERLYFLLWRFRMPFAGHNTVCDDYFKEVLIPCANRLGIGPIGVFDTWFGPESLSGKHALLPAASAEVLVNLDEHLSADANYRKLGAPFHNPEPPRTSFSRIDSALLQSFSQLPGLAVPENLQGNPNRIFELRTYAQPTLEAHRRKVDMFEAEEAQILEKFGLNAVFYARTLIGADSPSLTYMWVYDSLSARQDSEQRFFSSPEAGIFAAQKYANLPSRINNIILKPAAISQI